MTHKIVTHAPIPMPHIPGLLRRPSGRYVLNIRVPKELRGKFNNKDIIRKALGTSDWREAVSRWRYESHKLEMEFAEKRRELKQVDDAATRSVALNDLSEKEVHALVFRWFIDMEKSHQTWWDSRGHRLHDVDLLEPLDDLRIDEAVLMGGTKTIPASDCDDTAALLLKEENIRFDDGPAFRRLSGLLQRATLECLRRSMDRVERKPVQPREALFSGVFAHTAPPVIERSVTLGDLLKRHEAQIAASKRGGRGTCRTYKVPYRVLREALGEETPLEKIRKDDIEKIYEWLPQVPANATQRYPGKTLKQAVAEADRTENSHRLGGKTRRNYVTNITAIFTFAVTKELMKSNPAKDKYMVAMMERDRVVTPKALYSIDDLNRMFRTPLYTGCMNDGRGYLKPGNYRGRRGHFWIPLLALFHGFRCNEVVQLYTEDIKEDSDIVFVHVREERADGSASDKRLKTVQSTRKVPIHSELIRLGFLKFVQERRADSRSPRLFPELEKGRNGYFSDRFSKWFSRFKTAALGEDCKATFHSFRHMFRDALSEAGVATRDAERLGGWELMSRSAEAGYGQGPSLDYLRTQIDKVRYEGLDLEHLVG